MEELEKSLHIDVQSQERNVNTVNNTHVAPKAVYAHDAPKAPKAVHANEAPKASSTPGA